MIKIAWSISLAYLLLPTHAFAINQDYQIFEQIFAQWTEAFNQQKLEPVCQLFDKSITADYQGVPQKNYWDLCHGFEKIFNQTNMQYRYSFKLHQVYRANDLAAVRITWYLRISKDGKPISSVQDEGIDIFKKQADGRWRIVNFIGYPQKTRDQGIIK